MRKRILTALLTLCMVLTLVPISAGAADTLPTSGNFGPWDSSGKNYTDTVKWTLKDEVLTFSGVGEMCVAQVYWGVSTLNPWIGKGSNEANWKPNTTIHTVVYGNGITAIGGCLGLSNLNAVSIPNSVTHIQDSAFAMCTGLTNIALPQSVKYIEQYAFADCEKLTNITIPNGVVKIGKNAFEGCSSLERVTIPKSVLSIGENIFRGNFHHNAPNVKIYGYAGSEAEKYALVNDIPFVALDPNEEYPVPPVTDPCAKGHTWGNGKVTKAPTATEKGVKTYSCIVCGETSTEEIPATGTTTPDKPTVPAIFFDDVPAGEYYADAVNWAVSKNITNGTSKTTFSPDDSCTRAQAVTFLWRAAGQPEPASTNNPFTDVPADQYYYKAVLWAVEKGATNGISETEFGPNITCNRAQIVTFLHRYEGTPAANGEGFHDVPASEYYYAPVIWAVSKGVTNGVSATEFGPNNDCTRGQIVTFLYRDIVG